MAWLQVHFRRASETSVNWNYFCFFQSISMTSQPFSSLSPCSSMSPTVQCVFPGGECTQSIISRSQNNSALLLTKSPLWLKIIRAFLTQVGKGGVKPLEEEIYQKPYYTQWYVWTQSCTFKVFLIFTTKNLFLESRMVLWLQELDSQNRSFQNWGSWVVCGNSFLWASKQSVICFPLFFPQEECL